MRLQYELVDIEDLVFSPEVFIERVKEVVKSYRVVHVSLIGLPQTGKTNQAIFLSNIVSELALEKEAIPVILYYRFRRKKDIRDFPKALELWKRTLYFPYKEGYRRPNVVNVILDDLSFLAVKYGEHVNEFLNYLTQIKHYLAWCRRVVLYFIIHYSRATLPYLRISHIRALTSVSTRYEVAALKEYFNESALWNFYNYKINNPLHKVRYDTLYNIMGFETILQPPKAKPIVDLIDIRSLYKFYERIKVEGQGPSGQNKNIYSVEIFEENLREGPIQIMERPNYIDIYLRKKINGRERKIRIAKLVKI
ncbi:MAG: hypothetical protein J7K21_05455 [Desulfurococcales archaeon]|nr:hypothetical protein [Desulfurococcales archaeon]